MTDEQNQKASDASSLGVRLGILTTKRRKMNVRELIKELASEDNMDSTVYVRIVDEDGNEKFMAVDGIAVYNNSYQASNMRTCTTLELDA